MTNDNRLPLPSGTIIQCRSGDCYTIYGETVVRGGSSLIYTARRTNSERLFILKECYPLSESSFYIRNENWEIIPCTVDDPEGAYYLQKQKAALEHENEAGQIISRSAGRTIAAWESISVDKLVINGQSIMNKNCFIVMEQFGSKGCFLSDILKECSLTRSSRHLLRASGAPDIYTIVSIVAETLKALDEVHKAGYLYGDIHGNNLFFLNPHFELGDIGVGCLLDFGTVRKLQGDGLTSEITDHDIYSTEGYTAPEILFSNDGHLRLSPAVDIFSVGCLFLYLIKGENYARIQGKNISRIPQKSYVDRRELIKRGATEQSAKYLMEILQCALNFDYSKRYRDAYDMLEVVLELKALCRPVAFDNLNTIISNFDDTHIKKNTYLKIESSPNNYILSPNLSSSASFVKHSRDKELKQLALDIDVKQPLWIWGFAGIGKTELAIKFAETQKNKRKCYMVHYLGSLKKTIANLKFSGYTFIPDNDCIDNEDWEYSEKLQILKKYYKDALLIIDNFDSTDKSFIEMKQEPAYKDIIGLPLHVLFTTRNQPDYITPELLPMDTQSLITLFRSIVSDTNITDGKIIELIELVKGHSLFIELSAKIIEESLGMLSIDDMVSYIQKDENAHLINDYKIGNEKNRDYSEATIENHLCKLFSLSSLNKKEIEVLLHISLFSINGTSTFWIKQLFTPNEMKILRKLINMGWIKYADNRISMHPLLKKMCWTNSIIKFDWINDDFIVRLCMKLSDFYDDNKGYYNETLISQEKMGHIVYSDDFLNKLNIDQLEWIEKTMDKCIAYQDAQIHILKLFNSSVKMIDEQQYDEAAIILEQLSEARYDEAINKLGWMYVNGFGVNKNYKKAIELWEKAANECEHQSASSCKHLGMIFLGVHPDAADFHDVNPAKSLHYLEKAKQLGCEDVDDLIEQARSTLN